MGEIADAIRGTSLPEQNRKKLLSLDQEFVKMEAEIQALKSENLLLKAQVNPLEREINGLKNQIEKNAARSHGKLGELTEAILIAVANSADLITREQVMQRFQLSPAKGGHHFDILDEKGFVDVVGGGPDGVFVAATSDGRKYLAQHNLL